MREIKIYDGQTLLDICIQETGDVSRLKEIADMNNIDITADLEAGQVLLVPTDVATEKKRIVNYFRNPEKKPSTGVLPDDEGVDFWGIEDDFIIQ